MFRKIFDVVLFYSPWHRPLLAQPGPWREAIHCAFLSSFICASILIATCLLLAASLAAGVIRPTLQKMKRICSFPGGVCKALVDLVTIFATFPKLLYVFSEQKVRVGDWVMQWKPHTAIAVLLNFLL